MRKQAINIYVDRETHELLLELARVSGRSRSEIISLAVWEYSAETIGANNAVQERN